jgi:probable phosphoglycerate mutase
MKYIVTIQHTQSMHHVNGMVGSWTDWDLTELGREQADMIGRKLAEELKGDLETRKVVLYSSDLKRASQTADAVAKHTGLTPILKKELRERNLGKCCGKSIQWFCENVEREEKTVDDRMFSDAESVREEWNRLKPFFDGIISDDSEVVLIAAHSEILSVFNAMFLGMEVEDLNRCDIRGGAGGVSKMFVTDDGKRHMKRVSDMSYVECE